MERFNNGGRIFKRKGSAGIMIKDEIFKQLFVETLIEQDVRYDIDGMFEKGKEGYEKDVEELDSRDSLEIVEMLDEVDETFEDGGRWSNYRTRVFRGRVAGEGFVYVEVTDELPATEMQDGGDFMDPEIMRVYPHEVTTTVYKGSPQEK